MTAIEKGIKAFVWVLCVAVATARADVDLHRPTVESLESAVIDSAAAAR